MPQSLLFAVFLAFFPATIGFATNYTSVVPEPPREEAIGGYFANSKIPMEAQAGGGSIDFNRTILGVTFGAQSSRESAYSVGAGYALSAKPEGGSKGNGFNLAGTYIHQIHAMKKTRYFGYGGFEYTSENYSSRGIAGTLSYIGLKGGASALYALSKTVHPYGALDLFLLNRGDVSFEGVGSEVKRDSMIALRLGVQYLLKSVYLRPEVVLIGEQSFILAAGKAL